MSLGGTVTGDGRHCCGGWEALLREMAGTVGQIGDTVGWDRRHCCGK